MQNRFSIASFIILFPLLATAGGVVWSDRPSGTKAIRACNFQATEITNLYSSAGDPRGVIVDIAANRAYFCDRFSSTATSGEINSVPLSGGARAQHLTGLNRPADLRFDSVSRTLYWCEENGGLIRKAALPLDGGTLAAQILFSGLASPYYLDIDPANNKLYWTTSASSLYSGPLTGGSPDAALVTTGQGMRGVCLDRAQGLIYWCERDARVIRRRPVSGGAVEDLYTGLDTPHGLVLDLVARKLYWADTGTGGVGGFNARGISRGEMDGASAGAPEIIVAGTSANQPWDLDLDLRTPAYEEWMARFFRRDAPADLIDKTADPDGDGCSNLAEYAFGSSPLDSNSVTRITCLFIQEADQVFPAIRFLRRQGATDLAYEVQLSNDLQTWADNSSAQATVEIGAEPRGTEGMESVLVRSVVPASNAGQQFFRVRVTERY